MNKIEVRVAENLAGEIETFERRIAARAEEIFRARGGTGGSAESDWLQAERETVWRPAIEVRRTADTIVVEAAVAGLAPKQVQVRASPTTLLLTADVHHLDREQEGEVVHCEFASGPLFRACRLPDRIDPARAHAKYSHGLLRVTAPLARTAR